jgi:uncharacterized protein HemX
VNLEAFMEQRHETGGFWMAVAELGSTHPYLCKRVAELKEVVQPGTVVPVSRTPLAFPFAALFGGAAAGTGAMIAVMWIGILAAIAIPNFIKLQEEAKAAAAAQVQAAQEAAEEEQQEQHLADEDAEAEDAEPLADEEPKQASDSTP